MGFGRSGSTVLDAVLGNHPAICGVGELANLVSYGWLNGEFCSCGDRGNVCRFWTDVRREWCGRVGNQQIIEYPSLQRVFESRGSWPRLAREGIRRSRRFGTYAVSTRALFDSIRAVSGRPVVVDSSKSPMRAHALALTGTLDLRVIHLVRDARAVAWSLRKAYRKDDRAGIQKDFRPRLALRTALLWLFVNMQAMWVNRQLFRGRALTVRYEELATRPRAVLKELGVMLEIDLDELGAAVEQRAQITFAHSIAGNRLRMRRRFDLRFDSEWVEHLSERDKMIVWTVTGWLMRRFGYAER
ncbi:MAG TPA: sulfotransferase [Vicinamibacterales bacterium]|nr:sulfotransferase [Vicinamibacterales bacterium]